MNVEPSQIEHGLTEELATVARSVTTPPPPAVADLVRRADRKSAGTRRNLVVVSGLVAAAVVGAVLLGNQLGKPDTSPTPTPSPTETPTTYRVGSPLKAWADEKGAFYLNGVVVPGSWAGQATSGDLTTAQEGPYDTGTTGVFLGSRLVDRIHGVAVPEIAVSPDHRTIAWVGFDSADHKQGAVVVAKVDQDAVHLLGRLPTGRRMLYQGDETDTREHLFAVADDGTVTYGGPTYDGHTWKPGGAPQPADVTAYQNGPDGFPTTAAQDLQLNPTRTWGAWSTDGTQSPTDATDWRFRSVTVQRTGEPGSRAKISFPARYEYVNVVGWESDTDLVVYAAPQGSGATRYLRCDVLDRSCEYAPEPGS